MAMKKWATRSLGAVLGFWFAMGMTGCDYWPPALEAQIEQLRSEAQALAMEKAQLQAQVSELSKAKQEMQVQIDDLSRTNREKTGMIASLQNQLNAARTKALKAMSSPKKSTKSTGKSSAKPATRLPSKKKAAPKR